MPPAFELRCRACGRSAPTEELQYCEYCFGPLDLATRWDEIDGASAKAAIERGPDDISRYAPLLPAVPGSRAGCTPLTSAPGLARAVKFDGELWVKDDTANPTGSFKDRLVATALARAVERDARVVATASTGNLARAVLAAAGEAGLDAVVLVPEGTGIPGAIAVEGPYDALNRLTAEAASEYPDWAWINVGLRPWYVEGAATIAYETAEQLGWRVPDHVVAPIASGATLLRWHRAFGDLAAVGLVESAKVRVSVTQPAGCAPVAAAFARGDHTVAPVRAATEVRSLAMGDPPDGDDLLAAVYASGGAALAVDERAVSRGAALLRDTVGIDGEPAVGVAGEGLRLLVERGVVRPGECVVLHAGAGRLPAVGKAGGAPGVTIAATLDGLAAVLPDHLREGRS